MSTDIATAAEFHLTDWWDKNRRQVVWGAGVLAVVALGISYYLHAKNQRETDASEALSDVVTASGNAQAYVKVADQYSGTAAAARAVLQAAGSAFEDQQYAEAQGLFDRFLKEFPADPSRVTALLGVAASLDAQGKKADALEKYQDLVQRYADNPVAIPAKSALARLYEEQNQPDKAVALYQDLARSQQNASYGLESMVHLQGLLAQHPELMKAGATNANVKVP